MKIIIGICLGVGLFLLGWAFIFFMKLLENIGGFIGEKNLEWLVWLAVCIAIGVLFVCGVSVEIIKK